MLTRFVDVKGVATRVMSSGDASAPTLLLLHGLTLTSEIWTYHIDELGARFHTVAVDLLGHGFTRPRDGKPVGLAEKVEHLEDLIDVMGLKRVSLSGSSYGGLIAANVVLRKRRPIERLVINGSGSAFNTEEQLTAFMDRIQASYRPTLAESSPDMWRERLKGTVLDPRSIPCQLLTVLPICYAQDWAVPCWDRTIQMMRDPQQFRQFRILDRLGEFNLPTLVVWGLDDKGGNYESAVAATHCMPSADLIAFEQCAHLPMMEQPEKYNAAVRRFLEA